MVSLGSWVLSPVQPLELTALSGFIKLKDGLQSMWKEAFVA
jgi:hypothetical protein